VKGGYKILEMLTSGVPYSRTPFFFLMVEGSVEVSNYYEIFEVKTILEVLKGGPTVNFFMINCRHININNSQNLTCWYMEK
jgi:hypothetical protein